MSIAVQIGHLGASVRGAIVRPGDNEGVHQSYASKYGVMSPITYAIIELGSSPSTARRGASPA